MGILSYHPYRMPLTDLFDCLIRILILRTKLKSLSVYKRYAHIFMLRIRTRFHNIFDLRIRICTALQKKDLLIYDIRTQTNLPRLIITQQHAKNQQKRQTQKQHHPLFQIYHQNHCSQYTQNSQNTNPHSLRLVFLDHNILFHYPSKKRVKG